MHGVPATNITNNIFVHTRTQVTRLSPGDSLISQIYFRILFFFYPTLADGSGMPSQHFIMSVLFFSGLRDGFTDSPQATLPIQANEHKQ